LHLFRWRICSRYRSRVSYKTKPLNKAIFISVGWPIKYKIGKKVAFSWKYDIWGKYGSLNSSTLAGCNILWIKVNKGIASIFFIFLFRYVLLAVFIYYYVHFRALSFLLKSRFTLLQTTSINVPCFGRLCYKNHYF